MDRNYEVFEGAGGGLIKAWVRGVKVEDAARKQLENIAAMPFIFKHVAAMPDVHLGRGATVGSVIPTRGALIPAAVGVDIGCFTGDTLVRTLDGNSYPIAELAERGDEFIVFSCDPSSQHVSAARATAFKTRSDAELVEVELDSGERIRCTPDHKFLARDGSWVEARDMTPGMSLMPFNVATDTDGYDRVFQPDTGRTQVIHWVVARSGLLGDIPRAASSSYDDKVVIHHVEFMREGAKRDNRPSNLRFMTASEHAKLHRGFDGGWRNDDAEFQQRRLAGIERSKLDPDITARRKQQGRVNFEAYMRDRPDHFAAVTRDAGERGRASLIAYNKSDAGRARSREMANKVFECPMCGKQVKGHAGMGSHMRSIHSTTWNEAKAKGMTNHKVVAVRSLVEREDVYCLNVPGLHNFGLAAGVFVHNCGMVAQRFDIRVGELPDDMRDLRFAIEAAVPHGNSSEYPRHKKGGWRVEDVSNHTGSEWRRRLSPEYDRLAARHKAVLGETTLCQLGTLGGGNHFIEVCVDADDYVWLMLHSGSRGVGNRIGTHFISLAKREMERHFIHLPDKDLSYIVEGSELFDDYWAAVKWAQEYAKVNRELMLEAVVEACRKHVPAFHTAKRQHTAINCHHNYATLENHFGENVYVTRKGAIRAREGDMGIIPGSMGTRSYIVRGRGSAESFHSCSHGAGRAMSRAEARRRFTLADHERATVGIECRKDVGIIDETPEAYKPIEDVMSAQSDLVEVVTTLRQVLCVKGE